MITENFEESGLDEDASPSVDNSSTANSSPSDDQKRQIASWVNEGMGLSDIQKKINDDFGIVMTYMDVRFLVDDLNLDLIDEEEEEEEEEVEEEEDEEEEEEVYVVEIQGKKYYTNSEVNGDIYIYDDDEVGEKIGEFNKDGIAIFK